MLVILLTVIQLFMVIIWNMGAMFGDVVEFKNDDYFQEHKTGALFLLDDTYKITLFACVETQGI